jgi:hypothetical protein
MKKLATAAAVLLAASHGAYAGNLDTPVEHKITNRTEIARGADAAADCFGKALSADSVPVAFLACVSEVESAESRANTSSTPFILGLDVGMVIDKTIFAKNDPSYTRSFSYKDGLPHDREEIARIEKDLGISTDEACAAAGKAPGMCRAATTGVAQ